MPTHAGRSAGRADAPAGLKSASSELSQLEPTARRTQARVIAVLGVTVCAAFTLAGPTPGSSAAAETDPVVAAAGDIACQSTVPTATTCHHQATSELLLDPAISHVLALGDLQYPQGSLADFQGSYDPTWGRVFDKTSPIPGNHEYLTPGASGYFDYFGDRADPLGLGGYYSFNVGAWHLIALNSNIPVAEGTPQNNWLEQDLAADASRCTLAMVHEPLFSSRGSVKRIRALWQDLYRDRADVVLSGSSHNYERFAPQTPKGVASARGIRQFVVGTGGVNLKPANALAANSEVFQSHTFGVLKLTLHATTYDWQFQPEADQTWTDVGSGACV